MEVLALQERVSNTIALGEGHFREFKSALAGPPDRKTQRPAAHIASDIAEALTAFANADGGELLVGVEDDGEVTGVPHSDDEVAVMLRAPNTHTHADTNLPLTISTQLQLQGRRVLAFAVSKGTSEVFQLADGRCVKRQDNATVPAAVATILFERQEVRSREFDRQFVDGADIPDLDRDLLHTQAQNYLAGLSIERYLQQVGLAEFTGTGFRLRMACLLLFAKDIQRWHPRSQVRILKVGGSELKTGQHYNVISDETVQGNIFALIQEAWERLRPYLAYNTEFGASGQFEQRFVFPEEAFQEAIVNAIAHRDYSVQNGTDVYIYEDRTEIRSPGELLSTLTIDNLRQLRGAHESRNALVSRVLRESKFMRELGEGIRRMFQVMDRNELQPPTITSGAGCFTVTLTSKSVFSDREEEWLRMFAVADLSPLQKRIVVLGLDGRQIAPADIYSVIGTRDRNVYDREVTGLRNMGVLDVVRSNNEATRLSRAEGIAKAKVPRFSVRVPSDNLATGMTPDVRPAITRPATVPAGVTLPTNREPVRAPLEFPEERTVYVGRLHPAMDRPTLHKLFGPSGRIERVHLAGERSPGGHKGFAFIVYSTAAEAIAAIRNLDKSTCLGERIDVKPYVQRTKQDV